MTFARSDEQLELQRTVRAFLERKSPESEVRRVMETETGYDPSVWQQMASELGLHGLAIGEAHGGSGYGFGELAVVLEEMGRTLLCAPFLSTVVLAGTAITHAGDDAAAKEYLPRIASGELIATLAVLEQPGQWRQGAVATAARADGGTWRLSGTKRFVLDGHVADLILCAARTERGVGVFAVEPEAHGVTRTPLFTMDQTRKLADVSFDGTAARLVSEDGGGWSVVERALQFGVAALAAEQVGGAQRCLEMSVAYAKERYQFGRPIGSFQAVKHKCADMLVSVELARSAAGYAAACASTLEDDLPVAAAMAKSFCSEAFFRIAADTIQVHGGIGFTWEHPAHLYFKRAASSELLFGRPGHHREVLLEHLELA